MTRIVLSPIFLGMLFMVGSTLSFSAMNLGTRLLADDGMHSTQIVFLRNLISIFMVLPFLWHHRQVFMPPKASRSLHLWRNFIGIVGMQFWFYAMTQMPLNDATALSFTAPLFTTIIAVLVFKEVIGIHRVAALIVGFLGVLVILRPSAEVGVNPMALLVLFATTLWGTTSNIVKSLSAIEPGWRIIFIMTILMTLFSFPIALPWWQPVVGWLPWALLSFVAATSLAAHYCMVLAFSRADLVTLMPLDFTRLIFTAILAYIFLGEHIDFYTGLGAAIIVASCVYIAWREKMRRKSLQK